MGWFKTKKKHSVNTTVTRVIEDAQLPDSIKTNLLNSLIKNDDQIVENVMEGLVSGLGVRAHKMHRYATNGYSFGRPSAASMSSSYGEATVLARIQTLFGATATIEYYQFGPLNNLHDGWVQLLDQYGYQSSTNTLEVLSAIKGIPVYLKDMVPVLTSATLAETSLTGLQFWGVAPKVGVTPSRPVGGSANDAHTPIIVDPAALVDSVLVTYEWKNGNTILTDTLSIPFSTTSSDDDDYFQVKYAIDGESKYWTYKEGAGTYTDLDTLFSTDQLPFGSYFPFCYFRYNKQSMDVDTTSQEYITSKKMVGYIGMDYAEVVASINENPDITDVEQAMMMMAIPANSSNQTDLRYIFDFFSNVADYSEQDTTSSTVAAEVAQNNWFGRNNGTPYPSQVWVIQDSRFKMTLGSDAIFKRRKAGVIASVDGYTKEIKALTLEVPVTSTEPQYDELGQVIQEYETVSIPSFIYKHQVTATTYDEVEVINLQSRYYVWGGMTTVGDETDPTLLVPLDYTITSSYSIPDRELLYARSLHFVFNSHVITKIKWYQTGIFKVIMIIIAVVIAYYTGYFDPILIGLAAGGTAATIAIIAAIVDYLVVAYLFKLFVKAVGLKIAFIIAIIAFIAGAYQAIDFGSVAGAPWAEQLLTISTNLTTGMGDYIQAGMKELGKEAASFGEWVKEQTKLLESANELLEQNHKLSPFVIFGEHPNDFYNRTVHSGNIGVIGIEAVSSYVDIALTLPKAAETMGAN